MVASNAEATIFLLMKIIFGGGGVTRKARYATEEAG